MVNMISKYVQYRLNRARFEELLRAGGYKSHLDFCRRNFIHKNTLNYYLSGQDVFSKKIYEIAAALDVNPTDLIEPIERDRPVVDEIDGIIKELSQRSGVAVILLGSRARGKPEKYSDWDLGITGGEKPFGGREFLSLRGRVAELAENLPRKVDLVNLDAAPLWFLQSIDYEPIFLGGDEGTFLHFKGVLYGIGQCEADKSA